MIEDTAQSFGATYHGRALGTFGALGAFSLQQEKNITAGEGGLVVTDDETLYLRAARFQDQGGQFVTSYASARGEELTEPFAGENLRMGELAGRGRRRAARAAAGDPRALRARTRRGSSNAVGDVDGLARRRRPDPDGDGSSSITWFLPDAAAAKRFAAALRAEGVPCAQMYRGRPVYLNAAVLARRTASGKGGPWACAEHPTDRTYGPGLCPRTEALVARSVIVPVGVGYGERGLRRRRDRGAQGRAAEPAAVTVRFARRRLRHVGRAASTCRRSERPASMSPCSRADRESSARSGCATSGARGEVVDRVGGRDRSATTSTPS